MAVRSVLVVIGTAATVLAGPAGISLAAVGQSHGFAIASVLPTRGEVVGVAHPVVVTFSAPITNRQAAERAIEVKSKPAMTGKFEWLDSDIVQWVPDRFWPAHSTVALSVGGRSTDFKTGPVVLGVADISDHTFTVSIDGIDRVNAHGERVLPASMGRESYPTPVGSYTVMAKDRSVTMDSSSVGIPIDDPDGYRLSVDYAVRISSRGLYVHSAPWAVSSLGVDNVSHGCISLGPDQAEWYFNAVNIGDPVRVQK